MTRIATLATLGVDATSVTLTWTTVTSTATVFKVLYSSDLYTSSSPTFTVATGKALHPSLVATTKLSVLAEPLAWVLDGMDGCSEHAGVAVHGRRSD